jgi:hypothetical protein
MGTLHTRIRKLEEKQARRIDPPAEGDEVASLISALKRFVRDDAPVERDPLANVSDEVILWGLTGELKELLPLLPERIRSEIENRAWRAIVDHVRLKKGLTRDGRDW